MSAMTAGRRVPLGAIPNANNNTLPLNGVAAGTGAGAGGNNPTGMKRTRSHAGEQRELSYKSSNNNSSQNPLPPAKRLMIDGDRGSLSSRIPSVRKSNAASKPPNSFQKKLEALQVTKQTQSQRLPPPAAAADKMQKHADESLESIRLWQRHYRKAFPQFVFYFENIPEEQRSRVSRQVLSLGAREEAFFSKAITHVVTIRSIPPESGSANLSRGRQANASQNQDGSTSSKTIDPSLLNRNAENQALCQAQKSKFASDVAKKTKSGAFSDILLKAREMEMKIWALEKLERMMHTMFHTDTGEQPSLLPKSRVCVERNGLRVDPEADLSQMIKRERAHGHVDRDYSSAMQDRVHFRGYYVYVHDISEKLRPIMIRDYPKVAAKEDGKWPQFRLSGPGKCPFVEDPNHLRRLEQEERLLEKEEKERKSIKAEAATEEKKSVRNGGDFALRDVSHNLRSKQGAESRKIEEERGETGVEEVPVKKEEDDETSNKVKMEQVPLFGSAQANIRKMPRFAGGEPVASGMQPSNVTSAIRSQMISSTAAAPGGGRVAATKEVNHLQRRLLVRNSSNTSARNLSLSYLTDIRAALNSEKTGPATRAAKRKGLDKVIEIHDDNEDEAATVEATLSTRQPTMTTSALSKQHRERERARVEKERAKAKEREKEKELKPGYCENCREKFDDFDRHVVGRKHKKFALAKENWTELDDLLKHLTRH